MTGQNLDFLHAFAAGVTLAVDATHSNVGAIPRGMQAAGYTTGSGGIAWTSADWNAHPGAVRIDQDAGASDHTADVLDVETGAATPGECALWARLTKANYNSAARKGQREPAIYTSAGNVTTVVNALMHDGTTSGVYLWIANWNLTEAQAQAEVLAAAGPFPICGLQYTDHAVVYDNDVFSSAWLSKVSGAPPPPSGPFRQIVPSGNTMTLSGVARALGVSESSLVSLSQQFLTPSHLTVLADYVKLENDCVTSGDIQRPALPVGAVFYTSKQWTWP